MAGAIVDRALLDVNHGGQPVYPVAELTHFLAQMIPRSRV